MFKNYSKGSMNWQLSPKFKIKLWHDFWVEYYEDLKIERHFAGWLFLQIQWYEIN